MKVIRKIAERADVIFAQKETEGFETLSQETLKQTATSLLEMLRELEVYVSKTQLTSRTEIYYYKVVKPTIAGRIMFIHKLLVYERSYLANSNECHKLFYNSILGEIREYIATNQKLFIYYSMRNESLDNHYFTVSQSSINQCLSQISLDCYSLLTPVHSRTFAHFVCCELLNDFIAKRLEELHKEDSNDVEFRVSSLSWTGAKAYIVELGYSLFASSCINSGTATIKDIMQMLSDAFNIDLGDYYRVYTDIKSRKKDRVVFLQSLRTSLLQKMDSDDE